MGNQATAVNQGDGNILEVFTALGDSNVDNKGAATNRGNDNIVQAVVCYLFNAGTGNEASTTNQGGNNVVLAYLSLSFGLPTDFNDYNKAITCKKGNDNTVRSDTASDGSSNVQNEALATNKGNNNTVQAYTSVSFDTTSDFNVDSKVTATNMGSNGIVNAWAALDGNYNVLNEAIATNKGGVAVDLNDNLKNNQARAVSKGE